jgi:prepilin signal peptidase PulO-like enzyme (type II secretory pathway)
MLFVPLTEVGRLSDFWEPSIGCKRCKFTYRREPGYFFGAIIPALPILSLLSGFLTALAYYLIVKPKEFDEVLPSGVAGIAFGFLLFYRVAIAFYISVDHTMDPPLSKK